DLQRLNRISQVLPEIEEETWQLQVQNLYHFLTLPRVFTNTCLEYYYQLGLLLAV
ncbi:12164_t:CDS:1, partial [Gigaspora rosea]